MFFCEKYYGLKLIGPLLDGDRLNIFTLGKLIRNPEDLKFLDENLPGSNTTEAVKIDFHLAENADAMKINTSMCEEGEGTLEDMLKYFYLNGTTYYALYDKSSENQKGISVFPLLNRALKKLLEDSTIDRLNIKYDEYNTLKLKLFELYDLFGYLKQKDIYSGLIKIYKKLDREYIHDGDDNPLYSINSNLYNNNPVLYHAFTIMVYQYITKLICDLLNEIMKFTGNNDENIIEKYKYVQKINHNLIYFMFFYINTQKFVEDGGRVDHPWERTRQFFIKMNVYLLCEEPIQYMNTEKKDNVIKKQFTYSSTPDYKYETPLKTAFITNYNSVNNKTYNTRDSDEKIRQYTFDFDKVTQGFMNKFNNTYGTNISENIRSVENLYNIETDRGSSQKDRKYNLYPRFDKFFIGEPIEKGGPSIKKRPPPLIKPTPTGININYLIGNNELTTEDISNFNKFEVQTGLLQFIKEKTETLYDNMFHDVGDNNNSVKNIYLNADFMRKYIYKYLGQLVTNEYKNLDSIKIFNDDKYIVENVLVNVKKKLYPGITNSDDEYFNVVEDIVKYFDVSSSKDFDKNISKINKVYYDSTGVLYENIMIPTDKTKPVIETQVPVTPAPPPAIETNDTTETDNKQNIPSTISSTKMTGYNAEKAAAALQTQRENAKKAVEKREENKNKKNKKKTYDNTGGRRTRKKRPTSFPTP